MPILATDWRWRWPRSAARWARFEGVHLLPSKPCPELFQIRQNRIDGIASGRDNPQTIMNGDEVGAYGKAAKTAGLHIADDNKITQAEFMPACEKGVFDGLPQLHAAPKGPKPGG